MTRRITRTRTVTVPVRTPNGTRYQRVTIRTTVTVTR